MSDHFSDFHFYMNLTVLRNTHSVIRHFVKCPLFGIADSFLRTNWCYVLGRKPTKIKFQFPNILPKSHTISSRWYTVDPDFEFLAVEEFTRFHRCSYSPHNVLTTDSSGGELGSTLCRAEYLHKMILYSSIWEIQSVIYIRMDSCCIHGYLFYPLGHNPILRYQCSNFNRGSNGHVSILLSTWPLSGLLHFAHFCISSFRTATPAVPPNITVSPSPVSLSLHSQKAGVHLHLQLQPPLHSSESSHPYPLVQVPGEMGRDVFCMI